MNAKILPFDSPTYLRRMARELNALPDGFYHNGQRWTRASVSTIPCEPQSAMLKIHRPSEFNHNATKSTGFANLENVVFSDAYGRTVCASRRK
jgi:hypothetical protein